MRGLDLSGSVAVVTGVGGTHGIGFAVARVLSAMGARLVVSAAGDRVHQRAAELPPGTVGIAGDLTDGRTAGGLALTALTPKTGERLLVGGMVDVSWLPSEALILATHPTEPMLEETHA